MAQRHHRTAFAVGGLLILAVVIFLSACNSPARTIEPTAGAANGTQAQNTSPEWFNIPMTDAQTGKTFTINDLAGKVVLIETMATWCPTCRNQEDEVKKLHALLGDSTDLVSVSLDVDLHEDAALLKKYAQSFGYDWHFAVAPLEVQRALGNLYNAEYLNPPLAPMLLIDRAGKVYGLPYGLKSAQSLKATLGPHLTQ